MFQLANRGTPISTHQAGFATHLAANAQHITTLGPIHQTQIQTIIVYHQTYDRFHVLATARNNRNHQRKAPPQGNAYHVKRDISQLEKRDSNQRFKIIAYDINAAPSLATRANSV